MPPSPVCHPGLGPLGAKSSPRPLPKGPSASRVAAVARCGAAAGGGAAGRLGLPYVATCFTCPLQLGGPGVCGRHWRRPRSVVSGSEGDSIAVRACASRAAGVRLPGGTPTRVPRGSEVTPPSHMSWRTDGTGGGCPGSGGRGLLGGAPRAPGLHPPPSVPQPTGRRARLPASCQQPLRPAAPSSVGSAVTCASACDGAGAAAVAGSSGGSASGRGRRTGPGAARHWHPRP